ncbi:ribonuclease BN [Sphingomonas ginsenosidimutans]|jgi:membrane protein|uniref:Ribonuclease BN n=2 Tax=Sphingomonas ginsenosidimutans TaxID=862134 RepID=A0A2A4HXJ9_9SPHN|nr:ribonuclease BN [Sphingomonas ginsenosidimutans]
MPARAGIFGDGAAQEPREAPACAGATMNKHAGPLPPLPRSPVMRANLSSTDFWREFRRDWWGTLRRAYTASNDDNLGLIAAGTAFYAFSSIAPILAASVLSYGLIADAQTVQANIRTLFDLLPADAARLIGQQMDMVVSGSEGKKGLGLVIALAIAIYGGSRAATAMMTALNVAYEAKEKRNYLVWMLTAFAVVAGGVVLMLIGVSSSTVTAFLGNLIPGTPAIVRTAIGLCTYLLMAAVAVTGASLLFRFAPYRPRARLRWGTPGAVLATVVWLAATTGFSVYVVNFGNYGATYGSLGAIVVLLTWLWLSAYAFLLGAALDVQLYRACHAAPPAEPAPPAAAPPATTHTGPIAATGLAILGLALFAWRSGNR